MSSHPAHPTGKPDPASARRRLLRGAFALPALATVHPGTAWSASVVQCLVGPDVFSAWVTQQIDTYMRVELLSHGGKQYVSRTSLLSPLVMVPPGGSIPASLGTAQILINFNGQEYLEFSGSSLVSGSGLNALSSGTTSDSGTTMFSGLVYSGATSGSTPSTGSGSTASGYQPTKMYAAIVYNTSGDIVWVGMPSTSGAGDGVSSLLCWSSLIAARKVNLG